MLSAVLSRGSGKDIAELHQYCMELVDGINAKYGDGDYSPVVWLERPVRDEGMQLELFC